MLQQRYIEMKEQRQKDGCIRRMQNMKKIYITGQYNGLINEDTFSDIF